MLDPDSVDFEQLGFHAGIEVHHQIQSDRKLFCRCPPDLEKNPETRDYSFYRYFRPVLGEMGDFDPGMLVEFEKGYKVIYYACEHNTCTYEMDETPPFPPDHDAVEKGFILAHYFNCTALAEEIVVNRKQYLDGSITTGFQRTFITGRDGYVPVFDKKVRITNVHVEEDAARRVNWLETADRTVYFNLDRLGIPLTEIITDHRDVDSPQELVELARQIGRVLRISGIGRRGIGAARQDVNISIQGGNRAEIKGVQNLALFDRMCRHEVVRQHALIELRRKMLERGLKKEDFEHTYIDVTHLFALERGKAYATIFPKMRNLFGLEVQPGKDFGEETFEKSMLITGIPREDQFHSDEIQENAVRKRSLHPCRLPVNEERCRQVSSVLQTGPEDAFILVAGPEKRAIYAMKKVVERVKQALEGVPQETRRLLPNGNSEFLRVIHGKERIYPDTDTPPIVVPESLVNKTRKAVGKRPWELAQELHERYHFNQHQVDLLIRDEKTERFRTYTGKLGLSGPLAYRLLIELPRKKRREGVELTGRATDKLADALSRNLVTSRQVDLLANTFAEEPEATVDQAVERLSLKPVTEEELNLLIQQQLGSQDMARLQRDEAYRKIAIPKIVGAVLQAAQYSVEGKKVAEQVNVLIRKGIEENARHQEE
jgi:glutamyl-tRNA(Gln) amidotransferase subunit E